GICFINNGCEYSGTEEKKLFELLNNDKVKRIVLYGNAAVGKTWTAREISNLAKKKGLIDLALWISDALSGKKRLLVLDDEKTNEQQIMFDLGTLLNLDQRDYKVLITKRESLNSDISEDGEKSMIGVKPLSEKESFSLLQERAGTCAFVVPEIKDLANAFVATSSMIVGCIHYNELIAYWVMEGFLSHTNCMEKAYEKGHVVLMELMDLSDSEKSGG
ncbi:hypothetical protein HYC85_017786, partial [Camellia sinensis]